MPELLEFDAAGSNADGTDPGSPLSIMNANYRVLSHSYASPEEQVLFAESVDTEGGLPVGRHAVNRTITMSLEMVDATGSLLRALLAKVAKIRREGGTLKRTLATGQVGIFDLHTAGAVDPSFDISYYSGNLVKVDLSFIGKPYMRGASVTLTAHTESTLPCLVFTETGIAGDVPALGKLRITDAQGVDQGFVVWGMQSKEYSSSANAALFYEAETRTAMGGSATAAGPSGASGSGSNVMRNTDLASGFLAILSTQATGGGAHLSHVGGFRVFARVQVPATGTGTVSVAFQWAQGHLTNWTTNTTQVIDQSREGTWVLLDLGPIDIARVTYGTQRWEGRVLAKSTRSGYDIDIDCLYIVPVDEGYGVAVAVPTPPTATPTTYLARDDFNQTAGNLSGKTLPTGGTWTTVAIDAAATTDFAVDAANAVLTRIDTGSGPHRRGAHNGTNYTNISVDFDYEVNKALAGGALLRYVDNSNFASLQISATSFSLAIVVGGVTVALETALIGLSTGWRSFRVAVNAAGRWALYASAGTGGFYQLQASGRRSEFATGGVLASGKCGLIDDVATTARNFDNFRLWAPPTDAAMFASRSLEVSSFGALQEAAAGSNWSDHRNYEGDNLRVPPAGAEGRSVRFFVKASRNDPYDDGADPAIDDLTAQLTYVPRFLVAPS